MSDRSDFCVQPHDDISELESLRESLRQCQRRNNELRAEAYRYREALCDIIGITQGQRSRGIVNRIEDVALAAFPNAVYDDLIPHQKVSER